MTALSLQARDNLFASLLTLRRERGHATSTPAKVVAELESRRNSLKRQLADTECSLRHATEELNRVASGFAPRISQLDCQIRESAPPEVTELIREIDRVLTDLRTNAYARPELTGAAAALSELRRAADRCYRLPTLEALERVDLYAKQIKQIRHSALYPTAAA